MIDNQDGTVECSECGETYQNDTPVRDIIEKIAKGKRCKVCLGLIWDWVDTRN